MKSKPKLFILSLLAFVMLLLIVETICYFLLPKLQRQHGFFINRVGQPMAVQRPGNKFDLVDPLLGYGNTAATLNARGFKVESGCVVLTTTDDTTGRINILITGGSTSDLFLYPHNWPLAFCALLKQHGIKAKLYCAGTGGYNTAQELLKLIRDGLPVKPSIHISYTGANEPFDPSYTSFYEQNIFEVELDPGRTSRLMPNTVAYFRTLGLNHSGVSLRYNALKPHAGFMEANLRLMHGTSVAYNYRFIGILQPVLGSGKYRQSVPGCDTSLKQYRELFPQFKKTVAMYPDFMVDLTSMFDTCTGAVFLDNCHVEDAYQPLVAESIYNVLVERGVFKDER